MKNNNKKKKTTKEKFLHILALSVLKNKLGLGREMLSYLASQSVREQPKFHLFPCPIYSLGTRNMCDLSGNSNIVLL